MKLTLLILCLLQFSVNSQVTYQIDYVNPSGWSSLALDQSINSFSEQYLAISTNNGSYSQRIVSKFEASGQEIWSKEFYVTDPGDVSFRTCYATADGGVALIGSVEADKLVFKLDRNGLTEWSVTIPSAADVTMNSITEDSDGNLYISGGGCATGSISLLKISNEGSLIWYKSYHNIGGGTGHQIRILEDGNLMISGTVENYRAALLKIAPNGDLIFGKKFNNVFYEHVIRPHDFVELANGNIIIVGEANESFPTTIPEAFMLLCDSNGGLIDAEILKMPSYADIKVGIHSISTIKPEGDNQEVMLGVIFSKSGLKGSAFLKIDQTLNLIDNNSIQNFVGDRLYLEVAPNGDIYSSCTEQIYAQRIRQSTELTSPCLTNTETFSKSDLSMTESTISVVFDLATSVSPTTLTPIDFTWEKDVHCGSVNIEEETIDQILLNVFPNPTSSNLNIEINSEKQSYLELVNLTGVTLKSFELPGNGSKVLDVSKLTPGVYFVNVYNDENNISKRVVIE